MNHGKGVPSDRWFAMTMLDENRAKAQLAEKSHVAVKEVSNMVIWGNHSSTQYPDFYNAKICYKKVTEVIEDEAWLKEEFIPKVQQRGAAIIEARGLSSAASAANAAIDTIKALTTPTPAGEFFSVGVCGDGSYDTPKGIITSLPVRTEDGKTWSIVQGLEINEFSRAKIDASNAELKEEAEAVKQILGM
jgi:malate dehydrogenase